MREKINSLVALQKVETEINELRTNITMTEQKRSSLNGKIEAAEDDLKTRDAQLEALRKKYRSFEAESQIKTNSVQKSQEKLASVKTNKEYQAMLKEIDELKALNSKIEEDMIVCLDEIDIAEADVVKEQKKYKAVKHQISHDSESLQNDILQAKQELDELTVEKGQLEQKIDKQFLAAFLQAKERSGGVGIAPVLNAVCQGCHLNIPPQMFNELQRGDSLKTCPHCDRLIYWPD